MNETDGPSFYLNSPVPKERFFRSCISSSGLQSGCPEIHLQMGIMGACYVMMNTPETMVTIATPGLMSAQVFEIDVAQDEISTNSLSHSAGIYVSVKLTSRIYSPPLKDVCPGHILILYSELLAK